MSATTRRPLPRAALGLLLLVAALACCANLADAIHCNPRRDEPCCKNSIPVDSVCCYPVDSVCCSGLPTFDPCCDYSGVSPPGRGPGLTADNDDYVDAKGHIRVCHKAKNGPGSGTGPGPRPGAVTGPRTAGPGQPPLKVSVHALFTHL